MRRHRLVLERDVFVQPGWFYDMDHGAHVVVSLLTPEPSFREGVEVLAEAAER